MSVEDASIPPEADGSHTPEPDPRDASSTDSFPPVMIESRGAVDWITLNRPDRLNAITGEMVVTLSDHFEQRRAETDARIVVLRGRGRAFCSGLDLRSAGSEGIDRLPRLVELIYDAPQIVVAAVHGDACGGGLALALAADLRIVSGTARFRDAFIDLGLGGCELGLSYLLARTAGVSVAAELTMTGRQMDASRIVSTGLAVDAIDPDHLEEATADLVDDLLGTSPAGLRATKTLLHQVHSGEELPAVIRREQDVQTALLTGPEFSARIRSFQARSRTT